MMEAKDSAEKNGKEGGGGDQVLVNEGFF